MIMYLTSDGIDPTAGFQQRHAVSKSADTGQYEMGRIAQRIGFVHDHDRCTDISKSPTH